MDDDDEFGDLYADVVRPISSSAAAPPYPPSSDAAPKVTLDTLLVGVDDNNEGDFYGSSRAPLSAPSRFQTLAPSPAEDVDDDWMLGHAPPAVEQPASWDDDDDDDEPPPRLQDAQAPSLPVKDEPRVFAADDQEARVSKTPDETLGGSKDEGYAAPEEGVDNSFGGSGEKMEIGDLDQEPVIPGLSAATYSQVAFHGMNGGDAKTSKSDEWDSDSEDDLQIVLNDAHHGPLGVESTKGPGNDEDDDEDGEEDLVIVTDGDQHHHHHQAMEEQEWGEETMQMVPDGERKEMLEAGKGIGAVGAVTGPRIGYSNHGFHAQHHSMYKYIRPGAAPPAGGAAAAVAAAPGQVRPSLGTIPVAGRGRGDWRPAIGRGASTAQKSFHLGYGLPVWGNSSSTRAFGGGLDFTLPSHKMIFDIDIDSSFEEKPWRHPGVDISDFFNFGLDEDNWKAYCKQLDQLRLESTMQSKICVYESGRSVQDYDPDLPPELAAATGLHDTSDNLHHGKTDSRQADLLSGQGRTATCIRPPIPIGRAIQVEGGCGGERLPSIDTRPPRIRDSDAIIEIVCHDSVDDSAAYDGTLEQPDNLLHGEHLKGVHEAEDDDRHGELEYPDHFSHTSSSTRREMVSRRVPFTTEGDGILPFPAEVSLQSHSHSRSGGPAYPSNHGGSLPQGRAGGRSSSTKADHSIDGISSQKGQANRIGHLEEKSGDSAEGHHVSGASPPVAIETAKELIMEQRDNDHDERLALGDSIEIEGEDVVSDSRTSQGTNGDDSLVHSGKKQKLSSQVEQPVLQDSCDGEDLRTTHSDSSRVKLRCVKDHKKRHEGDEEVMQDGRSGQVGDLRRNHVEEDRKYRRKDGYGRDGRQEMETNHTTSKGCSVVYRSYTHRDLDANSNPVRGRNEVPEKLKERDGSIGVWQRREDAIHTRRVKDEDTRQECVEELGSRHRSKIRVTDRKDSNEEIITRKRIDDVNRRTRDRETTSRQRDRNNILINRREDLWDPYNRRRRDEEHIRREKVEKEDPLHGYRAREDPSRRKREREKDDGTDHKRQVDVTRTRDRPEDYHSTRHKDDSWHQKEREDRQRLRQPYDDAQRHQEREDRRAARNGRVIEDKPLGGHGKNKDESKGLGSDKDNELKDRRRPNEHPRRGDRTSEEKLLQHKGHEDAHAHENKLNDKERSSRHERSGSSNDHPSNTSDGQQTFREGHRDNTRKSNNNEVPGQTFEGLGKKKHEEHTSERSEQVRVKSANEEESNNSSATLPRKDQPQIHESAILPQVHDSMDQGEDLASDDENQDMRRGRSKLERWTSHKERDYSAVGNRKSLLSNTRVKELEGSSADLGEPEGLAKTGGDSTGELGPKDADVELSSEKTGEDLDKHLDTVAKLKRRSERFKLPMPGEKEVAGNQKVENELQPAWTNAADDAAFKPERPARKRRWTSG